MTARPVYPKGRKLARKTLYFHALGIVVKWKKQNSKSKLYYGDNMKKLEISFTDTSEKVVIDETSLIIALSNKTTPDGLTESFILDFDEDLPDKLLKHPLMFYIYDDLPILKLYRSVYISSYQWIT